MKRYYKMILGGKHLLAEQCFQEGWVGMHFGIDRDLSDLITTEYKDTRKVLIPELLNAGYETKIAAGKAASSLHAIAEGMNIGDIILSPDVRGIYHIGQVESEYEYAEGLEQPHRRRVSWTGKTFHKDHTSTSLSKALGYIGTLSSLDGYGEEIEALLISDHIQDEVSSLSNFSLEKHLEDFLVANWHMTELSKEYDILSDEDGIIGQQYPVDTGFIDLLAISKDKTKLLVLELKKGRASDAVVGQIQRYMGYIQSELAEDNQEVHGIIIALDADNRIQRALSVAQNISFYQYEMSFSLKQIEEAGSDLNG